MKNLFALLLILIIGLTSCEGRKTQNQALAESINEFKKNTSLEVKNYIPEQYLERSIDTTLSNNIATTSIDINGGTRSVLLGNAALVFNTSGTISVNLGNATT